MGFSLLARGAFAGVGELNRPWWQGLTTSTAASHVAAAKKMKRVRRKVNKSGTATSHIPSGAAHHAQLAQQAAAAAAVAAASTASNIGSEVQPARGAGSFAGDQATSSSSSGSSSNASAEASLGVSTSAEAAAAALQSYQPISADDALQVADSQQVEALKQLGALEASVHQQLHNNPAVMGSAAALQDLIAQQQQQADTSAAAAAAAHPQLQHLHSLSDSAMGAALRDAVAEPLQV
jgi:hypothetical protein